MYYSDNLKRAFWRFQSSSKLNWEFLQRSWYLLSSYPQSVSSRHPAGDTWGGKGYEAAWPPTANDLPLSGKSEPSGADELSLEEKQIISSKSCTWARAENQVRIGHFNQHQMWLTVDYIDVGEQIICSLTLENIFYVSGRFNIILASCSFRKQNLRGFPCNYAFFSAAPTTYHCKKKPLSHSVGAQFFLEGKREWFSQVMVYLLCSCTKYMIVCHQYDRDLFFSA